MELIIELSMFVWKSMTGEGKRGRKNMIIKEVKAPCYQLSGNMGKIPFQICKPMLSILESKFSPQGGKPNQCFSKDLNLLLIVSQGGRENWFHPNRIPSLFPLKWVWTSLQPGSEVSHVSCAADRQGIGAPHPMSSNRKSSVNIGPELLGGL